MKADTDESRAIAEVTARLERRFPAISVETVRETVRSAYDGFSGRPVRAFVPVLVEREVKQTLAHRVA